MLRGNATELRPNPSRHRVSQAWTDLSLRTKLLVFALGLVTVPGIVFALFAFVGTRAVLEREIGIQLQQTAERGADAVAMALERAQSDARSWASQDLMRELVVGDVDKRVSRFLRTLTDSKAGYLEVLCVDRDGTVVAASSGEWIGRKVTSWEDSRVGRDDTALVGPVSSSWSPREVIEIAVPIPNPDPPGDRIGHLLLIYEWDGIRALLDDIRSKLASLTKRVAALVVDRGGAVIGGVTFDGQSARPSALAAARWEGLPPHGYGKRTIAFPDDGPAEVLIGAALVADPSVGWSVVFVEWATEALAPVGAVRRRWTLLLAALLLAGLAAATLLARQVMRPLHDVTAATSAIAARPDLEVPLLPVRSRNEVGQLTESFNKMTTALKHSQDEALSAAKFAFAGELAAMIAHEVRTPLSVMRSSAQMLAPRMPADALAACATENTELVATIVAEVDRVERVVTGLIELARPLQQHLEPTRLRDLLVRAANFVAAEARRQQIRITCDVNVDGHRPALCDSEQIYQVILNLLVNALQALPPGGCVSLRLVPADNDTVGFEIADDGPGLPHDIRERVFQPFVTAREGGTGLGLAFVDRIVKAHRGSVVVQSEAGRGTVFRVRLPMAE